MSKLNQRIEKALDEWLNGEQISAAIKLEEIAHFSSLGQPMYFTGNRAAQTVFVQLYSGMNADMVEERWDFDTKCFSMMKSSYFHRYWSRNIHLRAAMSKEDKARTRQQAKDLQDQYDRALGRLYTMRNYFQWNRGVDREYISVYDKDWIPLFLVHDQICPL